MNAPAAPAPGRWQARWARWKHAVAALSFAAGIASFLLIERQVRVAQALVVLLPVSWLLAAFEPQLQRLAERHRLLRGSPLLLGYASQAMHQECFFFTLPFFFATASWFSPQVLFTAAVSLLALASLVDPFYYRHVLPRRAALWSFHAVAGFVAVLTAAPMLWRLTTSQSLWLALATLGIVSIPAWHALLRTARLRMLLAIGLGAGVAGLGWQLRAAVPPATLWVADMRMTATLDAPRRTPGPPLQSIAPAQLGNGLYAWTSIRAPRGLHERIEHHWVHEGRRVDVIALDITGGREAGYRAWSHKRAFPADPHGHWQVRVVTQGGQLLGQIGFFVEPPADAAGAVR